MCTAATYKTKDFYFGRTLDYDFSYAEEVTITPRNFIFRFRESEEMINHYAIIGMAFVKDNYPLYYDAVNEKGLCMAGLNFVGNAYYRKSKSGKINLAQFEFIPYILGKCASAVTVEFVKEGLKIYDNTAGVLTNTPPFDEQLFNLNNYIGLSPKDPKNYFSNKLKLKTYSRGMGALGLPGDLSSQSRFVRASFVRLNSVSGDSEEESVNQFFHILGAVEQQRGVCIVGKDGYEITVYTSCCNADKGVYYYTTYENHRITAIEMRKHNLDGKELIRYPLNRKEDFLFLNK